jgi:NTE family protein
MAEEMRIGLALSGGGARAIAFHLGCMRALHDRDLLDRISVLSAVSGGSVIAAMWAYQDTTFPEFEQRVLRLLRGGLVWGIARQTFASPETPKIALAVLTAGGTAAAGGLVRLAVRILGLVRLRTPRLTTLSDASSAPVRRFASRTTAFERMLGNKLFADRTLDHVAREGLKVVINATELRTGTAFRFGSEASGTWRLGVLREPATVARAVAASAAFPALLPALDLQLDFELRGQAASHRVILTDGGVYDNLGISCMLPNKSGKFSTNAHPVEFIIACDAGPGMPAGAARPFGWATRMLSSVETMHRRLQTQMYDLLHRMAANGEIEGFLLPYLGQIDGRLPLRPPDLVPRDAVMGYPTDFSPMSAANIELLAGRGEQLTRLLIEQHAPHL